MVRLLLTTAAAAAAAACAFLVPTGSAAAQGCGSAGYSYAGLLGDETGYGVGATIEPLSLPSVQDGHVAAWVGVGGPGLGPGGTDEWLQVGISADPVRGVALYYELALPGREPTYVMLKGHVKAYRTYNVAVREDPRRINSWRVWVNGVAVTPSIRLPQSHGSWSPIATTESWDGGVGACNAFAFRFTNVVSVARPGGSWALMSSRVIDAPGYSVSRRGPSDFDAGGGPLS
jgi:hypothetical protein